LSSPGVVWVRRQWNDYRDRKYRLAEVAGWHLSTESGGINQNAPRPFIHAYENWRIRARMGLVRTGSRFA
jgi:hypothetical protein